MKYIFLFISYLIVLNQGVAADLPLENSKKRTREEPCLNSQNAQENQLSLCDLPNDIRVLIFEKLIDDRLSKEINTDLTAIGKVNRKCRISVYKLDEMRWNRLFTNAQSWNQKLDLTFLAAEKGNAQLIEKFGLIDKRRLLAQFKNPLRIDGPHHHSQVIPIIFKYASDAFRSYLRFDKPLAHFAINLGKINILRTLAKVAPEYLSTSEDGHNNFTIAHTLAFNFIQLSENEKLEIFKLIVQYAPEILYQKNLYGLNPAYIAARQGNALILKELALHAPESLKGIFNYETPEISNPEIIEILYQFSPELLTFTDFVTKRNLLHIAAKNDHLDVFKALMRYIPELIKEKNSDGKTPLDILISQVKYFTNSYDREKARKTQDFIEELKAKNLI